MVVSDILRKPCTLGSKLWLCKHRKLFYADKVLIYFFINMLKITVLIVLCDCPGEGSSEKDCRW